MGSAVAPPPALAAGAFLLGVAAGSFFNVVIHRLPRGQSLLRPGSRCPDCAAEIRIRDLVPLFSWLWLRRRCRECGERISVRYPAVELLGGAIALWAVSGGDPVTAATRAVFGSLLLLLAVTDWETMLLPDALTLPGAAVGLLLAGLRPEPGFLSAAAGAVLGAGLILALRSLWLRFRGIEAVGLGDAKFLLLIGAFLGLPGTLFALTLAAAAGLAVAGPLWLAGKIRQDTPLPFGTLLAFGAAAVFFGLAGG